MGREGVVAEFDECRIERARGARSDLRENIFLEFVQSLERARVSARECLREGSSVQVPATLS